ncbi:acetyl-CoA C-acetyltransferase [Breoghania corrubedonensis]|uniref:Beta-ketothiolase n=1 Tax=Breoghania corrubedonensis TaxID=665038 RepID=A0A2T5V6J1_9HYPH|nr:thiolase family protein [Breoghania corrubedonensis]PTW59372.1 acetyl-CoA C-acetyltransferase [Breoghania corrubedonensis]
MREAVIVSTVRTPVGRCRGQFAPVPAHILGAAAVREAVARAKIDPARIDDVIYANLMNNEINNMGRMVALEADLPVTVPGITLDRQCAASLNALAYGAIQIMAGFADVIVAGGVESDSRRTYSLEKCEVPYSVAPPQFVDIHTAPDRVGHVTMGITAENVAKKYGFTRRQLDEFSAQSHARATKAWDAGLFDEQIVPIEVKGRKGSTMIRRDEPVRADCTADTLAALKPCFIADGIVTAGNSSPMSDGGGAMVIMERKAAEAEGLPILAVFRSYAAAGVDPNIMGVGPIAAVGKLLAREKLTVADIDLWELNEAFASQSLACIRDLGLPIDKVNPNGGAIALGHPLAGTGAILTAKTVYEMHRCDLEKAVITFCVGGGQGVAVLLTRD